MNIFYNTSRLKLEQDVSDPETRHLLVDAQIRQGLPLQLRAMREAREWTQAKLAEKLGTTQNAISRLENPKSRPATIPTLKRIAETFDVALIVKFAPFSDFVDSVSSMSEKSVSVPAYNSEAEERERTIQSQVFDWTGFLYSAETLKGVTFQEMPRLIYQNVPAVSMTLPQMMNLAEVKPNTTDESVPKRGAGVVDISLYKNKPERMDESLYAEPKRQERA